MQQHGGEKMQFTSMNIHGVQSIQQKVEPLVYGTVFLNTTELTITGKDGTEFKVVCFSDKPVTVETVQPDPVVEEPVPL